MGVAESFAKLMKVAIQQDRRNIGARGINPADHNLEIPSELIRSYCKISPERVFLRIEDGLAFQIFQIELLPRIQIEYQSAPYFVFASREGDPVALFNGSVWIALHGAGRFEFKLLSDNLENYWNLLITKVDIS